MLESGTPDAVDVVPQHLLGKDGTGEEEEKCASHGMQLTHQSVLPADVVLVNIHILTNS